MNQKKLLLESLNEVQFKFPSYYEKLKNSFNINTHEDIDEYLNNILSSPNRSFFTISSKEEFNNLESEKNWIKAIIFEPLNDHSRVFMHKGDIVFCYRQGQFDDLNEALNMRGIYGVGIVASEPEKLYSDKEKEYQNYGVCIVFPFSLKEHLELRNIQLNPITISLTPYNGNRNDALQHIQDKQQYTELLKMICNKNPQIKEHFEKLLKIDIPFELLPTQYWDKYNTKIITNIDNDDSPSTQTPTQIIFYGVPGSGKSYSIKKELSAKGITDLKEQTKRVVFHPEYTNADFVGQILPQSSDGGKTISYPFVPGPFTQILAKAYTHKNTHYALIIEEINRGNAAAIFGELFQLLDRLDEDETESSNEKSYEKGWSSYSINNDNINKSIQEAYENFKSDSNFELFINKEIFDTYKLNIGIRLPPNLSIFATMNTSDQNVFKLDNAFKRRWELRLIPNKFKEEQEEINQRDAVVESFDFTWNNFREAVNSIIIAPDNSIDISSFADRQIGCWFTKAIKKDEKYIIEKEVFVYKVLEYLWDDVCNGDIGIFFNENYKSFAELVEDVIEKKSTDIFSENLKGKLSQNKPE